MIYILSFVILCIPTAWELFNDAEGDFNKTTDVVIRILLMAIAAHAVHFMIDKPTWAALNLSIAIFFLTFDHLIVMILNRNVYEVKQNWFTHLGKTGIVDKVPFWVKIGPWGRFGIKAVYFVIALVLYIKLD